MMGGGRWLAGRALVLLYALPWVWLGCFCLFAAAVTLTIGRLPSYSDPDPKHVSGLHPFYTLTMLLLAATALSPVLVGAHLAARTLAGRSLRDWRGSLLAYAAGLSLAAMVIFGNVLGLSSWLFD